jgi:hypothetical protein
MRTGPAGGGLRELVVAIFLLGATALSWPILTIFNHARAVVGVPLLVLYLFVAWAAMIGAAFWVARRLDGRP